MIRFGKTRPFALTVFVAALCATSSCKRPSEEDKKDAAGVPVAVRTAVAEVRRLQPTFDVIGTVIAEPEKFASLTAPAPGLVAKLAVAEGTRVKAKDLIIQLDDREAQIALEKAQTAYDRLIAKPRPEELTQAKVAVEKLKVVHDATEARLKKSKELRARSPELVPDVQWLDDQEKESTARAEFQIAQATLQLLEKGPREEVRREAMVLVEAARLGVEFCRVVAPFDGEIVDIHARVGQRADVGTPLATIVDTSTVIVQVRVPADRLAEIVKSVAKHNDELGEVSSPSFPAVIIPISSGWLSQQTEGMTGDVPLRLRVVNQPPANPALRIGMTVRVKLNAPAVEALAVPETALSVNEDGESVVTIIKDNKAIQTTVELADEGESDVRADGFVRITKGLSAGDKVAIEKLYELSKDTTVTEVVEEKKDAD